MESEAYLYFQLDSDQFGIKMKNFTLCRKVLLTHQTICTNKGKTLKQI